MIIREFMADEGLVLAIIWWLVGAATVTFTHNLRCDIEDMIRECRAARRQRLQQSAPPIRHGQARQ